MPALSYTVPAEQGTGVYTGCEVIVLPTGPVPTSAKRGAASPDSHAKSPVARTAPKDLGPQTVRVLLLRHADVYAPEPLGIQDLIAVAGRIVALAPRLERPRLPSSVPLEIFDLHGAKLVPGFVDQHVHLAGGGGEGGFLNRTPPVPFTDLALAGTTTAVGLLGTDGVARSVQELYATVQGVNAWGLTAHMYTGAYELPTRTITGSVRTDIMLIDRVLGTGEIALSDDRSSHPSEDDLAHLAAETRVGGLLSGKAGVLHLHMGSGRRGLTPVLDLIERRDLPVTMFVPTHVNRRMPLLEQALELVRRDGHADLTSDFGPTQASPHTVSAHDGLKWLLDHGADPAHLTFSSDAGGSAPIFDARGELVDIGVGRPNALWRTVRRAHLECGIPLATALSLITENPSRLLKLPRKGRIAPGVDADLVTLREDLTVDRVWAQGVLFVQGGEPVRSAPFAARAGGLA